MPPEEMMSYKAGEITDENFYRVQPVEIKTMTRAEKAIKIAEFEGWELISDLLYKAPNKEGNTTLYRSYLVDVYSSFNGLMPIVERINIKHPTDRIEIKSNHVYCDLHDRIEQGFHYGDDIPLIDALQDAIIYYFENKEK